MSGPTQSPEGLVGELYRQMTLVRVSNLCARIQGDFAAMRSMLEAAGLRDDRDSVAELAEVFDQFAAHIEARRK